MPKLQNVKRFPQNQLMLNVLVVKLSGFTVCTVESPCIHWCAVLSEILAWPFFLRRPAVLYGVGFHWAWQQLDLPVFHSNLRDLFRSGPLAPCQDCTDQGALRLQLHEHKKIQKKHVTRDNSYKDRTSCQSMLNRQLLFIWPLDSVKHLAVQVHAYFHLIDPAGSLYSKTCT